MRSCDQLLASSYQSTTIKEGGGSSEEAGRGVCSDVDYEKFKVKEVLLAFLSRTLERLGCILQTVAMTQWDRPLATQVA